MELIRISESKLKIMLTPTDMSHFELDNESFGENCAKTRKAFRHLMDEIKRQIGFEADDSHVSVQYFPSREGGGEMFVTNLPTTAILPSKEETALIKPGNASFPVTAKSVGAFCKECAYRFEVLEDLLRVCKRLFTIGYIGESSAFRDEKKQYYLLLTVLCATPFSIPDELGFITEYSVWENPSLLKLYLLEHGSSISLRNAVEQLASLV